MTLHLTSTLTVQFSMLSTLTFVWQQIVLSGEGKNFCAGIDTASLEADFVTPSTTAQCPARARERLLHKISSSQHTITAIEKCRWPVIAAVQGMLRKMRNNADKMHRDVQVSSFFPKQLLLLLLLLLTSPCPCAIWLSAACSLPSDQLPSAAAH